MTPEQLSAMAAHSHDLEKLALTLSADGVDGRIVADELIEHAAGEREVAAIALSYLLRRRTLGETPPELPVVDAATDAIVTVLRRMPTTR